MTLESRKCVEQFNTKQRKPPLAAVLLSLVTLGIALHGSRPYGPVYLIEIIGGTFSAAIAIASISPRSCCR
jgi:hypothetical protein